MITPPDWSLIIEKSFVKVHGDQLVSSSAENAKLVIIKNEHESIDHTFTSISKKTSEEKFQVPHQRLITIFGIVLVNRNWN